MSHVSRLIASALLVALVARVASATPTPAESAKARALFREAQQHYKLAEYPQALDGFKETYRLLEDPSLLFNIAQCYRQLNRKEEAIRFFRTFLHDAPDVSDSDRESVEQSLASLEKALHDEQAPKAPPPTEAPAKVTGAPATETPASAAMETPASAATETPASKPSFATAPRDKKTPVYKRWWLWTTVAVVAAGAGVGLGIGLTRTPAAPSATTQDGTFHLFSLSF